LLPSGKFSKLALAVTVLLAALIVFVVEGIPEPATSLLFSNLVQTAIVLWAAYCSFRQARQSSEYLRQLWMLLTAALFLSGAAQAAESYYQSFAHAPALMPRPSDVLFIVWVTPAVMMFLPRPAEETGAIEWHHVLDFAQIGVVALTAYLYFFYVPSRWEAEGLQMVLKVIRLQMLRDAAIAAAFLIRAATISAPAVRAFFGRMAGFFLLASVAGLAYILGPHPSPARPDWTDIVWCAPYLFVVFSATNWNRQGESMPRAASSPFRAVIVSQVLPILIPLLVLFMGRRIAAEQIAIAWTAVGASFTLSAARLVLTNVKQRRIANDLLRTEQALRSSERMFSTAFRSSPDAIGISAIPGGQFLEVNDSFTRLTGYTNEETLGKTPVEMNLWKDPTHRAKVMAKLREESEIREEEFYCLTKWGETRICQFSGTLIELDGQLCALVIVRDVSARKKAEEALRASEERFRSLVRDFQVGVVLLGPDAAIQFANQAAQQMFGITMEQARAKNSSQLDLICIREDGTEIPFAMRPGPVVLKTGQAVKNEVTGWRRSGSSEVLWTLGNAVPQFAQDGSISAVINSFTNITERKRAEEALHQLSTRLLQLQDEERRRLGRELHDSLAQSVLAVNLNLAQVTQSLGSLDQRSRHALSEARRVLQEMSREIRTLSYLLHPPVLDELGLVSAVKEYAEGFSERSGIRLELKIQAGFGRLPQEPETALFRIVQESLSNIQRHSGSQTAKIRLHADSGWVNLEVSDLGRGMDKGAIDRGNGSGTRLGVGILGMRERMKQLGGRLEIESSSSGTTVRVAIPLEAGALNAGSHPGSG
jgi:two-component system NarL family sensor kinase